MMKITKLLLVVVVLISATLGALADRGIGKKSKNRIDLNISAPSSLRNAISLNIRSGLKYTGSLLLNQTYTNNNIFNNSLVSYQKGNTVYIIPYKQILTVPELKEGYTGMKLIIRPH